MVVATEGWLSISTEGFASMNAARPPEHLVKELLQNSLDSIPIGYPGRIYLSYGVREGHFFVECKDNGTGISDLSDLRVVYLTSKTDSHLKRGRFGRGFKEALCIAEEAVVISRCQKIQFLYENEQRITKIDDLETYCFKGTLVSMKMPWSIETSEVLDKYFRTFLVPEGTQVFINDKVIESRSSKYNVESKLPTEIYHFEGQNWKKPVRKTVIKLIPIIDDEAAKIYEMGIPVADVEWGLPFHCDVQQRIPMNPNRDAVASGYAKKLHISCLPVVLPHMDEDMVKQDWVGIAGVKCHEEVQKLVIEKAFGKNIARSVPKRGARQFDEDARELDIEIISTSQTSGGFREMLKEHVPTSKTVVEEDEIREAEQVAAQGFRTEEVNENGDRKAWIAKHGGEKRVDRCLNFSIWLCQQLVNSYPLSLPKVSGKLALNSSERGKRFYAHWSENNTLTLALDEECFWKEPFGAQSLEILIHEAAHAMNMHHGRDFRKEVERLAGIAASLMLADCKFIEKEWADIMEPCVSEE